MKELTVKELRAALEGVPDDLPVRLSSDTGVDQGYGEIVVERAYPARGKFVIYANDCCDEDDRPMTEEEKEQVEKIMQIIRKLEKLLRKK